MSILKSIRNNFIVLASKAVEEHINGEEITEKLDIQLDSQLGHNASEKIQRGPITNLLLEMLVGMWKENLWDLNVRIEKFQHDLNNHPLMKKQIKD